MDSGIQEVFEFGGEKFCFELCHKAESFSSVELNQWWMAVTALYAQRLQKNSTDPNHRTIIDFYWMMCRAEHAENCREAQERYLLATLLPLVRNQGSRRIFADPFLRRRTRKELKIQVAELDTLLLSHHGYHLTKAEFRARTYELLAHRPGTQRWYKDLARQLFDQACPELREGATAQAVIIVRERWREFEKSFGRRSGHAEQKCILDVLSYEARAAFHHCYSVAWCALIPRLQEQRQLNGAEVQFHRFWHLAEIDENASARGECRSLFHGHILGLHPGLSLFLLTVNGRELMGQWLLHPESEECYGQLLHGLYLSLWQFKVASQEASDRRPQPVIISGRDDLVAEEEIQLEKKSGHVRRKKSSDNWN